MNECIKNLEQDMLQAYQNVFDDNESIKICGRDACRHLIGLLECDAKRRGVSDSYRFGSTDTGIMNTEDVKEYARTYILR